MKGIEQFQHQLHYSVYPTKKFKNDDLPRLVCGPAVSGHGGRPGTASIHYGKIDRSLSIN
ncbi:hypothetical protein ON063_01440 [Exiguobacterium sp. B2(2022)]|uniref:hypothetical protein n=1 Tax=Exiguobacterium sp. B2(2022) TaxID=2992755 RepID=UPI00237BD6B5|nr:hypothetical protein [Exiguobacterium sp. B2(2022)]MDE0562309.1 hypothetical protein [Exiguobacterium sp. B2(2022)]